MLNMLKNENDIKNNSKAFNMNHILPFNERSEPKKTNHGKRIKRDAYGGVIGGTDPHQGAHSFLRARDSNPDCKKKS
jgi:hypothetical protein